MEQKRNKQALKNQEQSQKPLWAAVIGLVVSMLSYSMNDLMIGDVVFWAGLCFAALSLIYWFVNPSHGM
jgi:hypothetical protein